MEMPRVTTAIVPAGGHGTRFLPASKSVPKEMFPIGDKPIVFHVIQELVQSGVENIIFVVAHNKHSLENFFTFDDELDEYLLHHGKKEKVDELAAISKMATFSFVYTRPPYGNGGAILAAKHLVPSGQPFVVAWADELMLTGGKPRIRQCIETFQRFGKPTISAVEIKDPAVRCRYGMADLLPIDGEPQVFEIKRIVEKPAAGTEPSSFAAHGAYVLPYEIFDAFSDTPLGKDSELWLTDVINTLKRKTGLLAKVIPDCEYLDCGNPRDYLLSQLKFSLHYSPYANELRAQLAGLLQKNPFSRG